MVKKRKPRKPAAPFNPDAQALGWLAAGVAKTLTDARRKELRERMIVLNKRRKRSPRLKKPVFDKVIEKIGEQIGEEIAKVIGFK